MFFLYRITKKKKLKNSIEKRSLLLLVNKWKNWMTVKFWVFNSNIILYPF